MSWDVLAQLLGLQPSKANLPMEMPCPCCHKSLQIYQDTKNDQLCYFFRCLHCTISGDLIDLYYEIRGKQLYGRARKIASLTGAPLEHIQQLIELRKEERENSAKWNLANAWKGAVRSSPSRSNRVERSFALLGVTDKHRQELEAIPLLSRLITTCTSKGVEKHGGKRFIAKYIHPQQRQLTDSIVLPCYTTPGCPSSLAFLMLRTGGKLRPSFRQMPRADSCSGILCGDIASEVRSNYVVLTDQWLFTLQLQLRHLRIYKEFLPLAAWWSFLEASTQDNMSMFNGKRIIIWTNQITNEVMRRAVTYDAKIALCGPSKSLLSDVGKEWVYNHSSPSIAAYLAKQARPWREVAKKWYTRHPVELPGLAQNLENHGIDSEEFLRNCKLSRRVAGYRRHYYRSPEGHLIAEYPGGGWKLIGGNRKTISISNFTLRIKQVVYDRELDKLLYQGHVRTSDKRTHFLIADKQAEDPKMLYAVLSELCKKTGGGFLRIEEEFKDRLLEIATGLYRPRHSEKPADEALAAFEKQHQKLIPKLLNEIIETR